MDGDIAARRAVLLSARIRFSPEVQTLRETALDKMVEQTLLVSDRVEGLSEREILDLEQFSIPDGTPRFAPRSLRQSLVRLLCAKRIEAKPGKYEDVYCLSDLARLEIQQVQQEAASRLRRITEKLFKNAPGGVEIYAEPFLEALSRIFAKLGEAYVRVLKFDARMSDFVGTSTIDNALQLLALAKEVDVDCLRTGLTTFFLEEDPDFAAENAR
jgi:hypothetical protein